MAHTTTRQRPFPAFIIVCILFAGCLYLSQIGQDRLSGWLPGIAGLAKLDPGLIIMDIPVRLPVTVDLILLPASVIFLYSVVVLLYPSYRGADRFGEFRQRIGALFSSFFIVLCFLTVGDLLSWLVEGRLPRTIQNGLESLGMNADISLPFPGCKAIHLHGNFIAWICFGIGIIIAIGKINKAPTLTKPLRLTREQRMTPYQRMLQERSASTTRPTSAAPSTRSTSARRTSTVPTPPPSAKAAPASPAPAKPTPQPRPKAPTPAAAKLPAPNRSAANRPYPLCQSQPLFVLQPEAVNYRPLS
jgi:hypothetical protein